MTWNNINFRMNKIEKQLCLPQCVVKGSLKWLCNAVKDARETDANEVYSNSLDLDMNEEQYDLSQLARTNTFLNNAKNEKALHRYADDTKIPQPTTPLFARTMVEQPSDIGPVFKYAKALVTKSD